ncbi:Prion-inhibition and propagation [Teratosphaeria destructans]|uniref:Prion-inhibition and propagation n=1 Tax=Teratosphaeria destructans TaxID=418781 RepID=A0A9W7SIP9_9PEZI|nr:Prion-inhibition and propagation [Teratosphaeria destructans]
MAPDKANGDHVEDLGQHPQHEAELAGALALATLFSNCVEAFGLVRASKQWEREEQLLLVRLGLQQARLLIWGDMVGISSPPQTVTRAAVPKHPSAQYPDLKEPTFFVERDGRLDEPQIRTQVEHALSAIVDRSAHATREEMMREFGLKPPKHFSGQLQPAVDSTRLDAFREKFELLKEVAEDFARLGERRSNSIVQSSWVIADKQRFARFIDITKEKVDFLIDLLDVKEKVDRGVRVDIRSFGWHLTADRAKVATDTSKLRLLQQITQEDYPEYEIAVTQALSQIERDANENRLANPQHIAPVGPNLPTSTRTHANGKPERQDRHKRPGGLFGLSRLFGKSHQNIPRHKPLSPSSATNTHEPARSKSDAGVPSTMQNHEEDGGPLEPIRSKSLGDIIPRPGSLDEEMEKLRVRATVREERLGEDQAQEPAEVGGGILRHDQYHGIARTETRNLRQPGVQYE